MREVRMTFGEHLEELRGRIIISIIYLAVGVTVCFIYGDRLMEVAMWPHRRAYGGTIRKKIIKEMEETLNEIRPIMTSRPGEATVRGEPLVTEGEFHWGAVFGPQLLRDRMVRALVEPWETEGRELAAKLKSLSAEDRQVLRQSLESIGRQTAEAVVNLSGAELRLSGVTSLSVRFDRLTRRARAFAEADTAGSLKSRVGWGKTLDKVVEDLEELNDFLEKRFAEIQEHPPDLETLQSWARRRDISQGFEAVIESLEDSFSRLTSKEQPRIQAIDYTEQFSSYLKVVMVFGLFVSVPFILYELWKFVGAGLHLHEQKYVVTFLPFSLGLFAAGGVFGYFVLIPVGLEFLASWDATDVDVNIRLGNYIGLFLTLTLILGVVFQTPLVMIFLNKLNIVSVAVYRKARRISIFLGVCLAVVLTPPDPFSWSLMAAPMILLYELGIITCRMLTPKTEEEGES